MKVKPLKYFAVPLLLLSQMQTSLADSDSQPSYGDNFLLGDWGGSRTSMAEKGYEFEFIYTADFYNLDYFDSNTGQQEKKTVDLNNTDVTLTIDAEKAFGMNGTTFFLYILGNNGMEPTGEYVGDTQGFDNIEAPSIWKIQEAWYQKSFADDKFSLLFGLWDLNSEFDVIETAGVFSGSSHGVGPDFSQSGENGPSIFPATSLTLRTAFNFTDQIYGQFAILDGVPGDPAEADNNARIKLDADDGYLTVMEFGHAAKDEDRYHRFSFGFWAYTKATRDDIAAGNDIKNNGAYISIDSNLLQESSDSAQGLNGFLRYGFAEDEINDIKTYNGAGLVYTGMIPGRNDDQLALGIAIANPTDSFKSGEPAAESEVAIELAYYAQVTPWLAVKPDIQWIKNPGMVNNKAKATVIGVRFELSL